METLILKTENSWIRPRYDIYNENDGEYEVTMRQSLSDIFIKFMSNAWPIFPVYTVYDQ